MSQRAWNALSPGTRDAVQALIDAGGGGGGGGGGDTGATHWRGAYDPSNAYVVGDFTSVGGMLLCFIAPLAANAQLDFGSVAVLAVDATYVTEALAGFQVSDAAYADAGSFVATASAPLAAGDSEQLTIAVSNGGGVSGVPVSGQIWALRTTGPVKARVRVYTRADAQAADVDRDAATPPGPDACCALDFTLDVAEDSLIPLNAPFGAANTLTNWQVTLTNTDSVDATPSVEIDYHLLRA